MQHDRRDDETVVDDARLHVPALDTRKNIWSRWPWGLTALAVIVAGWVGVYLLWNGVTFLFGM